MGLAHVRGVGKPNCWCPGRKVSTPYPNSASMLAVARKLPIWFINSRRGKGTRSSSNSIPRLLRKKGERRVTGHAGCTWTCGAPATALALAYCGGGEKSLRGFCLPPGWVFRNISSNIRCQGMKSDPSLYLHSLPGDQMWRWEVAKFLTFAQIPLLRDPWPFGCQKGQERVTVGRVVPGVFHHLTEKWGRCPVFFF